MPQIHVKTASAQYPIVIARGVLPRLRARLAACHVALSTRFVFISSPEVWSLWSGAALTSFPPQHHPEVLLLPAGERHKRLAQVEKLADALARLRADRDTVLLGLGGGVVGDVTGFLAAIYMRGIRYIHLPTTLLAQVDSSVGGKTGVNLAAGKNLIGSFHQPLAVFADPATLSTLPPRELRAGMQEAIKSGLIADERLFAFIERNATTLLHAESPRHLEMLTRVVTASVRVKATIVSTDERESGERMLLNLGHTLGHAIEASTRYRGLLHGEAVAWGMIAALHLARDRQAITAEQASRAQRLIVAFGPLPRFRASAEQLVSLTAGDKKRRSGVLSFVLPLAPGRAVVVRDVTEAELLGAARSMLRDMSSGLGEPSPVPEPERTA